MMWDRVDMICDGVDMMYDGVDMVYNRICRRCAAVMGDQVYTRYMP